MTKLKLDTSNKYWQWVKDDMNSGKFDFPKNYWHDLATDTLDVPLIAPELPEVTVTPSTKDEQDLKTVQTGIPNKEIRRNVLRLLSDALPDNTSFNQAATKLAEVYSKSGNPKVSSGGSFIGMLDGSNSGSRAHVNRLTNHMYNVNDWSEFVAELAHSYNDRNIKDQGYGGFFGSLSSAKSGTESVYTRPYNREYTTHQYTEPLLDSYIRANDSSSNTLDDINSDVNFYVQQDKSRYKYPKLQNAVEAFKDLFRKQRGGKLNYLNLFQYDRK